MNADLPIALRDALTEWMQRLPPATDDPYYTARYRSHCHSGHHPAIAAILAHDSATTGVNHRYREVA